MAKLNCKTKAKAFSQLTCYSSSAPPALWHCGPEIFWIQKATYALSSYYCHNQYWASKFGPWTFGELCCQYLLVYASYATKKIYHTLSLKHLHHFLQYIREHNTELQNIALGLFYWRHLPAFLPKQNTRQHTKTSTDDHPSRHWLKTHLNRSCLNPVLGLCVYNVS